jgi:hypothetical protein
MFFEIAICVRILIKFDQNPSNYDEEITEATTVGYINSL